MDQAEVRWLRAFARNETGAGAAEFALVLPLFLVVVFATINMGFALSAFIKLHYATERGARCLSVDPAGICNGGNIDSFIKTHYPVGALSGLSFVASQPGCGNRVHATGTYKVYAGMITIPFTISASACYPII